MGKSVLYITTPGACVHQNHGRLRVTKGKELLQEMRLADVERVVLLGGTAGVTSTAAAALMGAGIETAFLSSTGRFRGFLAPARGRGTALRMAQFETHRASEARLKLARCFVTRKIGNSRTVLQRFRRNHPEFDGERERERMDAALRSAELATSIEALMGHEGEAAAAYFQALGKMIGGGFAFAQRSKRPPRDPANALLSLGYTLLTAEGTSAVAGAGLDPGVGMLHSLDEGRPSLALDLIEPFRAAVVDRLVLHLANHRLLSPLTDFTFEAETGPRLTPEARRVFLRAYEARMTESFRPHKSAEATTLRARLRREADALSRTFLTGCAFQPFALP